MALDEPGLHTKTRMNMDFFVEIMTENMPLPLLEKAVDALQHRGGLCPVCHQEDFLEHKDLCPVPMLENYLAEKTGIV